MIYVIAGTYAQFEEWRQLQDEPTAYRYVASPEKLLGLSGVKIVLVGTYWERPEILEEAKSRGLLTQRPEEGR